MTDPIERLRAFDPGAPEHPATAAGVRRRGDQYRRRRQGAIAVGAAATVAAVILPIAVLVGPGDQRPQPAPPVGPTLESPSQTAPPTEPDPDVDEDAATTGPAPIPADFPLADGWPDDSVAEPGPDSGLTGPAPDLDDPVFDYEACDRVVTVPEDTERLRAIWSNVEDLRGRQLLTFADADAAVAFMGEVVDLYRACPEEEPGSDGLTYTLTLVETGYGGQSYAVSRTPSLGGEPAVGVFAMVHVIRLGSAVLVDTTEGEGGGGGPGLAGLTRERSELMAEASAPVVAAMCEFTEEGC